MPQLLQPALRLPPHLLYSLYLQMVNIILFESSSTTFSFVVVGTPPSVVCMSTANPLVFQTLDVKLCSHLILVEINTDADVFQSALSSDTRPYLFLPTNIFFL